MTLKLEKNKHPYGCAIASSRESIFVPIWGEQVKLQGVIEKVAQATKDEKKWDTALWRICVCASLAESDPIRFIVHDYAVS